MIGVLEMEDLYLGWIEQLRKGLEQWGSVKVPGKYRLVFIAGMGGSGIVGDYVAALSNVKGSIPVLVSKSHLVPNFLSRDDLVFIVSYSGNTLETRIAYEKIAEKKSRIVIVSSNGLLESIATENNLPFIPIVKGIAPRTALPHMLYAILGVLDSSGYSIVSRDEAVDAYENLKNNMKEAVDKAYELSSFIDEHKGLPILATHTPFEALVVRGKNEFNENSKIPVKVEVAPEWMHNDIVGWEKPFENKYSAIIIRDPSDDVGSKLVDFMKKIYINNNIPIYELELHGKTFLEKLLYGSLVLGLASVKLARIRGVDPLVTENITLYKKDAPKIFGRS